MNCRLLWSERVEHYIRGKAPGPRRELFQAVKSLAAWNGRDQPPKIRHLEDELIGYSRVRIRGHRLNFRESFADGERELRFLYAGPRSTVYEAFQALLLDDLAR